jgi:hypothetical protein
MAPPTEPAKPTAGVHWWTAATGLDVKGIERVIGPLGPRERPGGFGHPFKRVHESGASVYFGSDLGGQPTVINAPGEVCESWWQQLADWSEQLGAWVTRIDLACDVEPAGLARQRLLQCRRAFKAGRAETRMRKESLELIQNDNPEEGWTLYLGGRNSELRFRIYDRRGPLRIEPQWRPPREIGERVPEWIRRRGPGAMWRQLAGQVKFPMPWYRELIEGDAVQVDAVPRVDALFKETLDQLNQQYGITFWALGLLGMGLDDLRSIPKRLRGSQAAKLLTWATAAESMGYHEGAEKLRQEVRKRCEPK